MKKTGVAPLIALVIGLFGSAGFAAENNIIETGKARAPGAPPEKLDGKITGRIASVDQNSKQVRIIEDNGQTTYLLVRKHCLFTRDSQSVAFSDIKKGDQVILDTAGEEK